MSRITPKPGMTVEISMGVGKSLLDAIEAAESLRKANEAERTDAELMRKEGEAGRITAEQERTMEEDARDRAESGRILAEESRVTAENLRSIGEQSRAEAEKGRSIAESGRANAEQQRVESEEMRENAEAARVTAEAARANAEALRHQTFETNEANRQTAYESAENARESEWTEIKHGMEISIGTAVEDANSAAESANAAAEKSVRYDAAQTLSDAQKAQARGNIDAADEESVDALKADLSNYLKVTTSDLQIDNLLNLETLVDGYVVNSTNGELESESGYSSTQFERVNGGRTYSSWRYSGSGAMNCFSGAWYDKQKKYISGFRNINVYEAPSNAYYVRLAFGNSNMDASRTPCVVESDTFTEYLPYRVEEVKFTTEYVQMSVYNKKIEELDTEIEALKNESREEIFDLKKSTSASTLGDGEKVTLADIPNCKKSNSIHFRAKIDTFSSLKLYHGLANYRSGILVIDSTKCTIFDGSTQHEQWDHGLTIADTIEVLIDVQDNFTANIMISTSNSSDTTGLNRKDGVYWVGCRDDIVVESIGSQLSDCVLSFYHADLLHDIWLFGDSYMDMYPNLCIEYGFGNFMLDGFSGRTSVQALKSLQLCISTKKPKTIIWALGMNDPDNSTINQNWLDTIEQVKTICVEKGIKLVMVTIPNNSYKNQYIKASGYKYIDLCNAVGADSSVNWYANMLSSDSVHPTKIGRRALALRLIQDMPEIRTI